MIYTSSGYRSTASRGLPSKYVSSSLRFLLGHYHILLALQSCSLWVDASLGRFSLVSELLINLVRVKFGTRTLWSILEHKERTISLGQRWEDSSDSSEKGYTLYVQRMKGVQRGRDVQRGKRECSTIVWDQGFRSGKLGERDAKNSSKELTERR